MVSNDGLTWTKDDPEKAIAVEMCIEITPSHQQYLITKHSTLDLDPIPDMNDENPLNWLPLIKNIQLSIIVFHAFFATFMAAGVVPAFGDIAIKFDVSIATASYVTSVQIIVLGVFPFLWVPITNQYGRKQVLMLSALGSMAFNLGCLFSKLYGILMFCRIGSAFLISPSVAIGGLVVTETTFSHQRASRNGLWTLMISLGTQFGPLLMGFVEHRIAPSWYAVQWVFWIFSIVNAIQFLVYLFIGKETVYDNSVWYPGINSVFKFTTRSYKDGNIKGKSAWRIFLSPLTCFTNMYILVPTLAYSICFSGANIALGVELSKLYIQKYNFNPEQIGLQFLGLIVGSLIGEQLGWISDIWMNPGSYKWKLGSKGVKKRTAESRLWISYIGFLFIITGLLVYGFRLQIEKTWTIVPVIGLAIAGGGLQMVSSLLIAFAIDTNPTKASDISLFVTVVRQVLGFAGPFYFPVMIDNKHIGILGFHGILAAMVFAIGFVPTFILHLRILLKRASIGTKETA